jgi:hypothetical protein
VPLALKNPIFQKIGFFWSAACPEKSDFFKQSEFFGVRLALKNPIFSKNRIFGSAAINKTIID